MKRIVFPPPKTIRNESFDLPIILERFVFTLDFWRAKERLRLGLSLMAKLATGTRATEAIVTDAEHELLEKGMKLDGQALAPELNGYYMACLGAVYDADNVVDPESPKAAAAAPE